MRDDLKCSIPEGTRESLVINIQEIRGLSKMDLGSFTMYRFHLLGMISKLYKLQVPSPHCLRALFIHLSIYLWVRGHYTVVHVHVCCEKCIQNLGILGDSRVESLFVISLAMLICMRRLVPREQDKILKPDKLKCRRITTT